MPSAKDESLRDRDCLRPELIDEWQARKSGSLSPVEPRHFTVGQALLGLLRNPVENLLRRWNWKSALTSACVRGGLFFVANLGAGVSAAAGAMSLEAAFYVVASGFYGAMTEAFRRARPAWAGTLAVMALIPAINHTLEFALHRTGGTKKLAASVAASVCLSMLSNAFSLFAMRRGAFTVGDDRQTLLEDFRQLPRIVFDFLAVVPRSLGRRQR